MSNEKTAKYKEVDNFHIGDKIKFVLNNKNNCGTVIETDSIGGTIRVEVPSEVVPGGSIKIWVPYFMIIKE